ncbi:hypothetical protein N6B72_21475 [Chryseobacterium soli]|uniref:hypothetical protein n=1 Tax=Chryseobacterium soli TaxID=445961 RepID=UPI002953118B|nr:hypothetical protein [Chryseobacterium soli]MDV7699490.1 hypothetical protein [Chryseobacterium soli]
MEILEQYNLRFVRRPFIFHHGKTIVKKQAVHDEEDEYWGYFLNRYSDPDDIDAIIITIDGIVNEGFHPPESASDIYLESIHIEYTNTALLFQTKDDVLIREVPFEEVREILLLWKSFIMTPLSPSSPTHKNTFQMPVTTYFEDHNRKRISIPEEASLYHYKVYEENGTILKREEYDEHKLLTVFYYLQDHETEQEAIETIGKDYAGIEGFAVVKTEKLNGYTKEVNRFYTADGIYDEFCITTLFDQNNCMIYEREESYFKGVHDIETRKYYIEDAKEVFEFVYKNSGELLLMKGFEPPFVAENNGSITVSEMELFFPDFLSQHPYYKNAEMIP